MADTAAKEAFVSGLGGGDPGELVVLLGLVAGGVLVLRGAAERVPRVLHGPLEALCVPGLLAGARAGGGTPLALAWGAPLVGLALARGGGRGPQLARAARTRATLGVYRGAMMLATCICILAVDFAVFPRRFAKTEEFGFSLMDVGVASFVFSSGLVASAAPSLGRALVDSAIVLLLGLARLAVTWLVGYHQHVSEYGTHWNFFLSLGILLAAARALRVSTWTRPLWPALALLAATQYVLVSAGVTEWIMTAPRGPSFWSHNREGIVQLPGMGAALLLGVAATQRLRKGEPLLPLAAVLAVLAMVCNALVQPASRRLANAAYVLCSAALNMALLAALDIINEFYGPPVEYLLPSISRNQLPVFLVANLLTGAINLTVDTINTPNLTATFIILGYTMLVCVAALIVPKITGKRR